MEELFPSQIDWQKWVANTPVDFEKLWQENLNEHGVGSNPLVAYFEGALSGRINLHEPLNIVPIPNAKNLRTDEINRIFEVKTQMFASALWKITQKYYEDHDDSMEGFSQKIVVDCLKDKIEETIEEGRARLIYLQILEEASAQTSVALTDAIAEKIIDLLTVDDVAIIMEEAPVAHAAHFTAGFIERDETNEAEIFNAYVGYQVYEVLSGGTIELY